MRYVSLSLSGAEVGRVVVRCARGVQIARVVRPFLLLLCAAAPLAAQEASPYVPLDHWSMPYVEHLIASGALRDPTPLTRPIRQADLVRADRKSTRLNSSHRCISYAVFCLKKKTQADTRGADRLPKLHPLITEMRMSRTKSRFDSFVLLLAFIHVSLVAVMSLSLAP